MLVLYLEPNQLMVVPLTNVQGVLSDKSEVCVKLLTTSVQGVAEFLNEVVLLTGIRHQNLVKLKGCCLNESQRIVVYEFVENRNLAEALWGMSIFTLSLFPFPPLKKTKFTAYSGKISELQYLF